LPAIPRVEAEERREVPSAPTAGAFEQVGISFLGCGRCGQQLWARSSSALLPFQACLRCPLLMVTPPLCLEVWQGKDLRRASFGMGQRKGVSDFAGSLRPRWWRELPGDPHPGATQIFITDRGWAKDFVRPCTPGAPKLGFLGEPRGRLAGNRRGGGGGGGGGGGTSKIGADLRSCFSGKSIGLVRETAGDWRSRFILSGLWRWGNWSEVSKVCALAAEHTGRKILW